MRQILFVDDEPRILDGLRRMLRTQRDRWKMVFVNSGAAALELLASAPFDVVVSDMRMPGMDGAALLRHVQERFPRVVRIVLSGQSELEAAFRAVPIAHQFLSKPCEASVLAETVERACSLQELLGDETLRSAIGAVDSLPTLPRTYAALTQTLADPQGSLQDITRIVERDVGISAKVLQLVNTAFFGLPRRMTNVQGAISLLGINILRSLVISVEITHAFESSEKLEGFSLEAEQRHAMDTAHIARRLLTDKREVEDAFMAAMLHDIGKLILATRIPEHFARVIVAVRDRGCPMHVAEEGISGVTHAEVGAYLLGLWGLPYPVVEAVAHHHAPARVATGTFGVLGAVHVADALSRNRAPDDVSPLELDDAYLENLGVTDRLPAWRSMARGGEGAADGA